MILSRVPRNFSVRTHLLVLVIGTLLPALAVAALLIRRLVDADRAAVQQELIATARAQATEVDRELSGTIRALQGLAESDHLTTGDFNAFRDQALRLLPEQPMWFAVVLSRPDGRQIFNTAMPESEPPTAAVDPDVFDKVITTHQPVIGDLRVGRIIKQPGFPVHVPVTRNGQVIDVLSALITSKAFADVLNREAKLSDEWVRGVVDANGVVVARSRDPERFIGQKGTPDFLGRYAKTDEGVYRDVALDGTPVYGAFSRAPVSRWIGGVGVPASVVDADFNQSMTALGLIGLALLGVGGVAAFVIARRISGDISSVADAAQAVARGEPPRLPQSAVREVRQLSEALERARELIQTRRRERDEADRAKDHFLAMLGHELRNPLAPVSTALQLMRRRYPEVPARELDVIERQIEHLSRLVDDLLDLSRLRRQRISLKHETFDLRDAIERAAEMTAPIFSERRHELDLRLPEPLMVTGDLVRLAQVFANLFTNAAKYTEPGGHVVVSTHVDNDQVVVQCHDNGIGMDAELLPRVFDLFVQGAPDSDRHQGGLGLGLALVRALVTQHGGTIEARSGGPGQGSTFIVRLPLAQEEASERILSPTSSSKEA